MATDGTLTMEAGHCFSGGPASMASAVCRLRAGAAVALDRALPSPAKPQAFTPRRPRFGQPSRRPPRKPFARKLQSRWPNCLPRASSPALCPTRSTPISASRVRGRVMDRPPRRVRCRCPSPGQRLLRDLARPGVDRRDMDLRPRRLRRPLRHGTPGQAGLADGVPDFCAPSGARQQKKVSIEPGVTRSQT